MQSSGLRGDFGTLTTVTESGRDLLQTKKKGSGFEKLERDGTKFFIVLCLERRREGTQNGFVASKHFAFLVPPKASKRYYYY